MSHQRLISLSLIYICVSLISGCTCGGLLLWGGAKCDNLITPNWENRKAKFAGALNREVDKLFPTDSLCDLKYTTFNTQPDGSISYSYSHGQGCTYHCEVKESIVKSTSFKGGESEQSCWLSLN